MTEKLFLLGIGCQKGGTTWMHSQLAEHPSIDLGFIKEYHIFDTLHIESCKEILERRIEINEQLSGENKNLLKLIDFCRDTNNYFDYFDYLYGKSEATRIVGDITPSYSGLPRDVLRHIKDQAKDRGFRTKIIFLMRDPIERIWSQMRMYRKTILENDPRFVFCRTEQDALLNIYKSDKFEFRTRYENTINNIESIFDSNDIFYGFYEKLFTVESVKEIEAFLGISGLNVNFGRKINESPKADTYLKPEVAQRIVDYYRNTYLFCDSRFNTKNIWRGYQYL